jgi:hypothetical protein
MSIEYGVTFAQVNNQEALTAIAKLGNGLIRVGNVSSVEDGEDFVVGICIVDDKEIKVPYEVKQSKDLDPSKADSVNVDAEKVLITFTNTRSIDVVIDRLQEAKKVMEEYKSSYEIPMTNSFYE